MVKVFVEICDYMIALLLEIFHYIVYWAVWIYDCSSILRLI